MILRKAWEMMRLFMIKLVNLVLVGAVLFGYQSYARERAAQRADYEQRQADADAAWAEAAEEEAQNQDKAETGTAGYADGVYKGSGDGFGGEIQVEVKVEHGRIAAVEILSARHETPEYLDAAQALTEDIVKAQSADVDVVSGATYSSKGILSAAEEALSAAEAK